METLSQLLMQAPTTLVTVGQSEDKEDHVTLVTSTIGITWWNNFSSQFAIDAGILCKDYMRPYGYLYHNGNVWACRIWEGSSLKYQFDAASHGEFERYAEFIPVSILLVDMIDVDYVASTLLRMKYRRVSGICMDTAIESG